MRYYPGGASRDSEEGKLDFEGFDSPLVNKRYAQYMDTHRKQADGSIRGSDNWQAGIDKEAYVKSLVRHIEDLKLHWDGFGDEAVDPNLESVICACLFNLKGLLFELLKDKRKAKNAITNTHLTILDDATGFSYALPTTQHYTHSTQWGFTGATPTPAEPLPTNQQPPTVDHEADTCGCSNCRDQSKSRNKANTQSQ